MRGRPCPRRSHEELTEHHRVLQQEARRLVGREGAGAEVRGEVLADPRRPDARTEREGAGGVQSGAGSGAGGHGRGGARHRRGGSETGPPTYN